MYFFFKEKNKLSEDMKTNFQDNTWSRHQNTVYHADAVQQESGRAEFEKA